MGRSPPIIKNTKKMQMGQGKSIEIYIKSDYFFIIGSSLFDITNEMKNPPKKTRNLRLFPNFGFCYNLN